MAYNPYLDVLRVVWHGNLDGKENALTAHYMQLNTDAFFWPDDCYPQFGSVAKGLWTSFVGPNVCDQYELTAVSLYRFSVVVDGPTYPAAPRKWAFSLLSQFTYTDGLPLDGMISTDYLPGFVAVCGKRNSTAPGRFGKGRIHYPGVPEVSTLNERLTNTAYTDWVASNNAFCTNSLVATIGINNYVLSPGLLSNTRLQRTDAARGENAGDFFSYTRTYAVNKVLGTMRRRKVRGPF